MPLQVNIMLVKRQDIIEILPFVEHYIKDAMQYNNDWTYTDLVTSLLTEHCKLWVVSHDNKLLAAVVTQVYLYPLKKEVRIHLLAGEETEKWAKEWSHTIETYAISEGAKSIDLMGRKGWERYLRPYGYKPITHMRKEVT